MGLLEILQRQRMLGNDVGGGAMAMPLNGNMSPRNPFLDYLDQNKGKITSAFGGMVGAGNDPRQALMGWSKGLQHGQSVDEENAILQQQEAEKKAAFDKETQQQNYTIQALQKAGRTDLVDAVNGGGMSLSDAWTAHTKSGEPYTLSEGQVRYGGNNEPVANGPVAQPDPKDSFGFEKDLAAQYSSQQPVKLYDEVKAGYERVRTSATADSGAGDVGVVYGFMKMLDPGSVVREGEFATAEQTAGIPAQIVGLYNKLVSGERLTPEQRQQFVTMSDSLYDEAAANLTDINTQFSTRAGAWKVDPTRFVRQPETFEPIQLQDYKTKYGLE